MTAITFLFAAFIVAAFLGGEAIFLMVKPKDTDKIGDPFTVHARLTEGETS